METHPNPAEALSDGPNQIPLEKLSFVLNQLSAVYRVVRENPIS
jgi:2-dehydro-3-deoxyphosphooctonate aldolase (KDO 8-P synthase)